MTSANLSLGERLKNNRMYIGRTLWTSLVALPFFAAYFILGVIMMVSRSVNYAAIYNQSQEILRGEKIAAVERITGMNSITWLMVAGCAVMFALQGFSYVFNISQIDFYLSQPTTRAQRIRKNYVNAHTTFLMMYIGCEVVALIIAAAMGAVNGNVLMSAGIETVRNFILFFTYYNITVLAVMLSGSLPIAILLTAGFTFISIILSGEVMLFKSIFFATYTASEPMTVILSPLYDRIAAMGSLYTDSLSRAVQKSGYIAENLKIITRGEVDILIVGIIAFVAVLVFSRFRKTEHVGQSIPIRPFRWFIKILVCILIGLGAGYFVYLLYSGVWNTRLYMMMCVIMVLATILAGCVTEIILEGNIRRMFKGMAQTVMGIAVVVLVFVIYRGDLLGYDSFVPAADKIESCAFKIYTNSFNYFDSINGGRYEFDTSEYMKITDIDDFLTIAKAGMETQREITMASQEGKYPDVGYSTEIIYRMKSGRKIYRQITIPYDTVDESLERILSGDEYKTGGFEVFHDEIIREVMAKASNKTLSFVTPGATNSTKDFDYAEVSDAYRKDILENYSFSEVRNKMPIATVEIEVNGESYAYGSFEIYDNYRNIISLMKKYGIYSDSVVNPDDIEKLVITNYYPGHDMDTEDYADIPDDLESTSVTYTEKDKIKAVLDASIANNYYNQWYNYNNNNTGYSIEVYKNGEMYSGAYYTFLKGKVPGFVAEDTNR